jgi:hypothetical protein
MENKNNNILFMALAGIGLYLYFKKKSTISPVVPPTTGGGGGIEPPVDAHPPADAIAPVIAIIDTPILDVKPTPIDVIPKLTDPIVDIIGITPIYTEPEPIFLYPSDPIAPKLKGDIEIGELDKGEYGGGGGGDNFVSTEPIFLYPSDPIAPKLKGSIEVGQLDEGEYGDKNDNFPITPFPIFDLPIFTKPEPILKGKIEVGDLDTGEYVIETPVPNVNYGGGGGGGGTASGGDFGGGGGSFGSGQNFLFDFIWFNDTPTLKGSIEVGNLDQGEFL